MPKRDDASRSAIGVAAGGVPGAIGAVAVTGLLADVTFTKVAIGVAITAGCSLIGLVVMWWIGTPSRPTMSAALRASGAVFDPDGNTVGYAFAATSELVVTTPVVVNRALARPRAHRRWTGGDSCFGGLLLDRKGRELYRR